MNDQTMTTMQMKTPSNEVRARGNAFQWLCMGALVLLTFFIYSPVLGF